VALTALWIKNWIRVLIWSRKINRILKHYWEIRESNNEQELLHIDNLYNALGESCRRKKTLVNPHSKMRVIPSGMSSLEIFISENNLFCKSFEYTGINQGKFIYKFDLYCWFCQRSSENMCWNFHLKIFAYLKSIDFLDNNKVILREVTGVNFWKLLGIVVDCCNMPDVER